VPIWLLALAHAAPDDSPSEMPGEAVDPTRVSSIIEARRKPGDRSTARVGPRLPGHWMPSLGSSPGPTGVPVPMVTLQGRGL